MQALSCGRSLVTGGGMAIPERDKPEAANIGNIRVAASKMDFGTPKRAPSGSRVCPTPKSVQVPGGIKTCASQTQEFSKLVHEPDVEDSENQPTIVPNFTTYSNPAFEPLDTVGSSPKVPKQPPCIPVDSDGQRLCPTPKSTRSSTSPGASKLRFPKTTSFQPLETIQSPTVSKDQTKRVLGDSNGQWTQETPKASKQQGITPSGRSAAFGTSCAENMTPRALFNSKEAASNMKKRARGEDEVTRATRSKTEAEKIATFLRSPAARVRPDGTREEYRLGVSDVLVKQFMAKKMTMEIKACQCDPLKACVGCDTGEDSSLKPAPVSKGSSPSVRQLRAESPGLARSTTLLSVQLSGKKTPAASRSGRTTPQGSAAKKNLSVLLEAQK